MMPPQRRRSPTITDVARLADVSITTVSFVLNEAPERSIADGTRRRVRAAAEQLGYRPNAAAKVLRTRRSDTIGFITDEVASTPFAGNIIRGAREAAWAHGKVLIVVDTGYDAAVAASAVEVMLERRVEGIIFAAKYHRAVAPPPSAGEVPTVLLDCVAVDRSLPSVVPDEAGGGRTATEALLRKGHRRIGFINLIPGIPASTGRLDGYAAALRRHGIKFDPLLVRYTDSDVPGRGYRAARELLALADPPTGIFCGNDRTAMEVYDAVKGRGLRIPEDVAIVGFDDMEIIAAHLRPALSTVALPHAAMGRWAVEFLIRHRDGPWAEPEQHLLPCPYVERDSV